MMEMLCDSVFVDEREPIELVLVGVHFVALGESVRIDLDGLPV
jgi:hypothetical protein